METYSESIRLLSRRLPRDSSFNCLISRQCNAAKYTNWYTNRPETAVNNEQHSIRGSGLNKGLSKQLGTTRNEQGKTSNPRVAGSNPAGRALESRYGGTLRELRLRLHLVRPSLANAGGCVLDAKEYGSRAAHARERGQPTTA